MTVDQTIAVDDALGDLAYSRAARRSRIESLVKACLAYLVLIGMVLYAGIRFWLFVAGIMASSEGMRRDPMSTSSAPYWKL